MRIAEQSPTVLIVKDNNLLIIILGLALILAGFFGLAYKWMSLIYLSTILGGLLMIASAQITTVIFNKENSQFIFLQKSFLTKVVEKSGDLNTIKSIELSSTYNRQTYMRVTLILNNGEKLILADENSIAKKGGTIIKEICLFLNLPFNDDETRPLLPFGIFFGLG